MKRARLALAVTATLSALAACGDDAIDATVATLEVVRGTVNLAEHAAPRVARATAGAEIDTREGALARLDLDTGPDVLLGPSTTAAVGADGGLSLSFGRIFVDVRAGERLEVTTGGGSLRVSDAGISVDASDRGIAVYVVRGEVPYTSGETRGVARAGERLVLGGEQPTVEAAVLWEDWTGGMARPGPGEAVAPEGVGTLEARVPDEIGLARWPLAIRRLDVRVRIDGDLAITEVDQIFFNPASETVEGLYRIRVPEEAVLSRFAVDRAGRLVDGYVRERAQAQQAYQAQVYRGSTDDPALLEWDAPGAYRARIYPIAPGETRRIVIRYAEWLERPAPEAPRIYRYPMGGGSGATRIQELALVADVSESGSDHVRAGMGAEVDGSNVELRRSDFVPHADFWLELVDGEAPAQLVARRAPHTPPQRDPSSRAITNEADERDYFMVPVVLPASVFGEGEQAGIDLVIVADVSAATDRSQLELGRSVVESLTAHLGERDRLAIVTSDLTIRSVEGEGRPTLDTATPARIDALLDGLSRAAAGGATDLGAAVADAAALLDESRPSAIVYVGDGAPTVGELGAEALLQRIARLPSPVRLYAVGVGAEANLELLDSLTRGGGLAVRVEERSSAADAALRVLAHATRPIAHRVTVDLGTGIDNAFPRAAVDVVAEDALVVVGRVRDTPPSEITVRGLVRGEPFEAKLRVRTEESPDEADLRLRWAGERLRQLLLGGATREEVAELGTRYGLITPFTSYYVPSARELAEMGATARVLVDAPVLALADRAPRDAHPMRLGLAGRAPIALGLVPLALSACDDEQETASASGDVSAVAGPEGEDESRDHEGEEAQTETTTEATPPSEPGGSMAVTVPTPDTASAPASARPSVNVDGRFADGDEADRNNAHWAQDPVAGVEAPVEQERLRRAEDDGLAMEGNREAAEQQQRELVIGGGQMPDNQNTLDTWANNEPGDSAGLRIAGTGRGGGGTGEGTIGLGTLGTIGHGGGGGSGSGYGRAVTERAVLATVRTGNANVTGSLSREIVRRVVRRHINEARFCYEQGLNQQPGLAGTVLTDFVISPSGAVQSSEVTSTTLGNPRVEQCIAGAVRRWTFPAPDGGGTVRVRFPFTLSSEGGAVAAGGGGGDGGWAIIHTTIVTPLHRPRRCSDAAGLILDDRRALWRERLSRADGPAGWAEVYENAMRDCETPSWRDRRALLTIILERAGSIDQMLALYRVLSDGSARGFLRSAILRRVRSPEDLRAVREAFALTQSVDWELVQQVIDRAPSPAARVRALRDLVEQMPWSFDLKLRLLEELEHQRRIPEAKRLADRMREDPLADPGVRTAIGEMFLRVRDEDEARRVFSEIVEFAPLDELARRRLGDLYRAHGWFEEAYRQYQTLAEIRPDDPTVLLLLAQAAAGAGRVDEALRLEQRVAEMAPPGSMDGLARTALLWSSVRFAKLRHAAREAHDDDRLDALLARMRRSGVLGQAAQLRVSLVWSHPDARLSLWASHPGLGLSRPTDLAPELGIEAFDVVEAESGRYRIEVRRPPAESGFHTTAMEAELVVVWGEGTPEEKVEVVPVRFAASSGAAAPGDLAFAWTIEGRNLSRTTSEGWGGAR